MLCTYWCKSQKVIITDANRPLISKETIKRCEILLKRNPVVITTCKSINTACVSEGGKYMKNIIPRKTMYDMLMPQCFDFDLLYRSHLNSSLKDATDDTAIVKEYDKTIPIKMLNISFWEGLKLTYIEDYKIFELLLKEQ
jgi:2-C-methyl-D-erythritol 4-phosphate cytidylyltransferase